MDDKATLIMKSVQDDGEEISKVELTTDCMFSITNGKVVISYEESGATGFEGCTTSVVFNGANEVTVNRNGSFESSLLLELGKKHFCHYGTPYGSLIIGVYTELIKNEIGIDGGKAYVSYTIDMNSSSISKNEIFFEVMLRT